MPKFCHNCGKQVQVGAKFCGECGTNLGSLSAAPPSLQPTKPVIPVIVGGPSQDDDYIDHIEHLEIRQNSLQLEISQSQVQGEKIGSAVLQGIHQGAPNPNDLIPRDAPYTKDVDKKTFEEDFRREAGAYRPNEKQHTVKPEA